MHTNNVLTTLLHERPPALPDPAEVMTALIELPPGDSGNPAHRHARADRGWVPLNPTWRTGFTGSPTRTRTSPP